MKQLQLFFTAWAVAMRATLPRFFWLAGMAACAGLLLLTGAADFARQPPAPIRLAVVGADQGALTAMLLDLVEDPSLVGTFASVEVVSEEQAAHAGYHAVIRLPAGFVESILNGENLSPRIEVRTDGPLEAMLIRQLADSAARALSEAQLGIYTVQQLAAERLLLDERTKTLIMMDVNLSFLRSFLGKNEAIQAQAISATGGLSLPRYYLSALMAALCLGYGFLCYTGIDSLRRFSLRAGRRIMLFAASCAQALTCSALVSCAVLLPSMLSKMVSPDQLAGIAASLALLAAAFSMFCCTLCSGAAPCAAVCILGTLGMGACSGLFLPLPMMPAAYTVLSGWLPTGLAARLYASSMGVELATGTIARTLTVSALLLLGALVLWLFRKEGERT